MLNSGFSQKLARMCRLWWKVSSDGAGFKEFDFEDEDGGDLETRQANLVAVEGGYESKVIPGLVLPAGGATTMDVLLCARALMRTPSPAAYTRILWAPTPADAAAAGAEWTPDSVVLHVHIDAAVVKAARAELTELSVRPNDTMRSLVARLSSSSVLDDILVPWKGRGDGGRTERLNVSTKPQPRRISYSVRGSPPFRRDGVEVEMKLNYTAYRRHARHHIARRMPPGVFDLLLSVWLAARPYMYGVSADVPFTHVQLLLYYECMNGSMGQHRDNNNSADFKRFMEGVQKGGSDTGNCVSAGGENSQVPHSWVAVFTTGTGEMMCQLRFPPKEDRFCNREYYIARPCFCLQLGPGTLFLMAPRDDLYFTHEADFETEWVGAAGTDPAVGDSEVREAWVFRHLESLKPFHLEGAGNCAFADETIRTYETGLKKRKAKKAAAMRRQACRLN